MSAIEAIRKRPQTTLVILTLVIACAAAYAFFSLKTPQSTVQTETPKVFFTTDDEPATWFPDDESNTPPFSKDGKQAVRIHLYNPGPGKPPLVGHLERLSPHALSQIAALKGKLNVEYQIAELKESGIEVKRKADTQWTPGNSAEASKIRQPPTAANGDPLPEVGP